MAFVQKNVTVNTTATLLASVPTGNRQNIPVYIMNNDSAIIWVGMSNVTTSGATIGHKIAAGGQQQFWCNSGDVIYGISVAGTTAGSVVVTYSA
jgi:hypothetical protein